MDAEKYHPYCNTQKQRDIVDGVAEFGNPTGYAKSVGMNDSNARMTWRNVKARAARGGYAPEKGLEDSTCPEGFVLDKSTIHTKDGGMVQRWDRVSHNKELMYQSAMRAIEIACENIKPRPKVAKPKRTVKTLLSQYTWADIHMGMYAWADHGGADWNIDLAKKCVFKCMKSLMDRSPDSHVGVLMNVGDIAHFDGMKPVTPKHGHVLDASGLFDEVQEATLDICVWAIDELLTKHNKVKVIMAPGNHDPATSGWLRKALPRVYRDNPRVEVDQTPFGYFGLTWGENFIGCAHGDIKKMIGLPTVFAAEPRYFEAWGKAKRCYLNCGHLHSEVVASVGKARIEQHTTIIPRDTHSACGGYAEDRRMSVIVIDKERGEVERYWEHPL